jgi:hypothetical protein
VTYDHVNGHIETVDEEGILVDIANNFGVATMPVYLAAEFDGFGATLFMQMYDGSLVFFDGLESGTTDAWSAYLE